LLKAGDARFSEHEPVAIVRQPRDSEKGGDERHGRAEEGERASDGRDARRSCRDHARRPAEWTKSRHETQPAVR
jgi:hypothetical protein